MTAASAPLRRSVCCFRRPICGLSRPIFAADQGDAARIGRPYSEHDASFAIALDRVSSNGYSFQIELTYRAVLQGMRVKEVPIVFVDRTAGRSKMSRKIFIEAIGMVWKLRLDAARGRLP